METIIPWWHDTAIATATAAGTEVPLRAFAIGVLFGIVLLAAVLHAAASLRRGRSARRGPLITGWADLFRLLLGLSRGAFSLILGFLLLCRLLLWPAGRRW